MRGRCMKWGDSFWDISSFQCRDFGFTAARPLTSGDISRSNTNIKLNIWNFSQVWKIYRLPGSKMSSSDEYKWARCTAAYWWRATSRAASPLQRRHGESETLRERRAGKQGNAMFENDTRPTENLHSVLVLACLFAMKGRAKSHPFIADQNV